MFPPPPRPEDAPAPPPQREEEEPTQQAAQEPKPVNEDDTYKFKSVSQEEVPNLGSNQGSLSNVTRAPTADDLPSKPANLRDTNLISNETPQSSGKSIFSNADNLFSKADMNDALKNAPEIGELIGDVTGDPISKGADIASAGVKSAASAGDSVAEAGSAAASAAGETDLALGGPEDPIGDVVSAVVGIGTFLGSLFGDKPKAPPKPPPPPQIRSTFQIGQDV